MKLRIATLVSGLAILVPGVCLAIASCDGAGQVVVPAMMRWATGLTIVGLMVTFLGLIQIEDLARVRREKERQARARRSWQRFFEDDYGYVGRPRDRRLTRVR